MKFWEAMKALEKGLPVRRVDLIDPIFPEDVCGSEYEADITTEWELSKEPEQIFSFDQIVNVIEEDNSRINKFHCTKCFKNWLEKSSKDENEDNQIDKLCEFCCIKERTSLETLNRMVEVLPTACPSDYPKLLTLLMKHAVLKEKP